MDSIYFIEKYKFFDLKESIDHWVDKSKKGSYIPPRLPVNYYYVRKIGEKNFLFVTFANNYLLKPSTGYFIVVGLKKPLLLLMLFLITITNTGLNLIGVKKIHF